jgi:hypothetical protein
MSWLLKVTHLWVAFSSLRSQVESWNDGFKETNIPLFHHSIWLIKKAVKNMVILSES